jgi:hypothetical protein
VSAVEKSGHRQELRGGDDALAAAPVYSNLEHPASVAHRSAAIISEPHHRRQ